MIKSASFHPIDLQTWPMAEAFHYYTQIAPTTYTVNVSIDVTAMRKGLKEKGYKFFPAYLFLVTKALAEQHEMCVAKHESIIGYWDWLTPLYPVFHEDTKTTSLLWTEFVDDFSMFHQKYMDDTIQHSQQQGILSSKGVPPSNAYVVSCIPWLSFDSFSLHNQGVQDYFFPTLEVGKFVQSERGILMPLSITVHHATTEGYHLSKFIEKLQYNMLNLNEWM